jgi:uncharacterized protein
MTAGDDMPWYIALILSIIIILIGIYKKQNIGLTMLIGAFFLGLLVGLPFNIFIKVFFDGLVNKITVMLIISIILLGILGNILKQTGAMEEILVNLQSLLSDIRVIAAAIPALISMLTVPGGAILSAPLCAEAGNIMALPPHRQAAVNIWFRHVLYFILPLFPSLILASQLSGVSMSHFVLFNLPLTAIGIIFGFYYLFWGYKKRSKGNNLSGLKIWGLLRSILPLILIMFLVVAFELYFPLAIVAGIVLALLNFMPAGNYIFTLYKRLKTMILPGIKLPVALVIIGIMIYKEMLEKSEVLIDMTDLILELGIPVIVLITFIPFLIGMLTGDNSASVAVIFPMFIPLFPLDNFTVYTAYAAYLYASSTAGHIISPAHPCFALTKEYFKEDTKNIIVLILPLLAVVMFTGLLVTILASYL